MSKTQSALIFGALIVLGLIGAFAGGMYFQRRTSNTANTALQAKFDTAQKKVTSLEAVVNKLPVTLRGEVTVADTSTVTVKLTDGSTKKMLYANGVSISQTLPKTAADIKKGDKLVLTGTYSTTQFTASTVRIQP